MSPEKRPYPVAFSAPDARVTAVVCRGRRGRRPPEKETTDARPDAGGCGNRCGDHLSGVGGAGAGLAAAQYGRAYWPADFPVFAMAGAAQDRDVIVDNFGTRLGAPENAPFLPFGQAKTALALAPEGVHPKNVKMGMTKCARF